MGNEAGGTQSNSEAAQGEPVGGLLEDGSAPAAVPGSPAKPCAACGEPHAGQRLLLTVEWEEYLSDHHGIPTPDDECYAPLCSGCASRAEILEIAEMALGTHGPRPQRTILDERNRFLEALRPELITNLSVSRTLNNYE